MKAYSSNGLSCFWSSGVLVVFKKRIQENHLTLYIQFVKYEGTLDVTIERTIDKEYVLHASDIGKIALRLGVEIEF